MHRVNKTRSKYRASHDFIKLIRGEACIHVLVRTTSNSSFLALQPPTKTKNMNRLEWEVHQKRSELIELQKQLSDTNILFYKEKHDKLECKAEIRRLQLNKEEQGRRVHNLLTLVRKQNKFHFLSVFC